MPVKSHYCKSSKLQCNTGHKNAETVNMVYMGGRFRFKTLKTNKYKSQDIFVNAVSLFLKLLVYISWVSSAQHIYV